jgi:phosphatidylserine synthase
MDQFINIIGWIGAILYLVAYGLVFAKKVEGDSRLYQGLNILAGALLIVNTFYLRAYPSAGLNIAWVGIACVTLGRKVWTNAAHG